jgi:hypothetical protein
MSEWIDLTEALIICELCQHSYSAKSFLEHLNVHSIEEVKALKQLAELSLKDKEQYKALCWELLRLEYFSVQQKQKT